MKQACATALVTLIVLVGCTTADGSIISTAQNTSYFLAVSDPAYFADTSAYYFNLVDLQAAAIGDSASYHLTIGSLAQNFIWGVGGGFSFDWLRNGTNHYAGSLQAESALTGTMTILFSAPAGTSFSQSLIMTGTSDEHYVLSFYDGGINLPSPGYPYSLVIDIPGDWSTLGGSEGDHKLISLNPNWKITSNFVYDSDRATTEFSAQELHYQGDKPGLRFQLIGAPVPEPSSLALLGSGLVGLIGMARRRRR